MSHKLPPHSGQVSGLSVPEPLLALDARQFARGHPSLEADVLRHHGRGAGRLAYQPGQQRAELGRPTRWSTSVAWRAWRGISG